MARFLVSSVVTGILMLGFAAGAEAAPKLPKPMAIGSNASGLPSTPAVAVDSTGAAYIVWLSPPADTVLNFCKIPVGATGCSAVTLQVPDPSHAQYFDPPSVLVNGTDVYVFEEVDGAANQNQDGMYEWLSTDGGATFTALPYAISYTAVGDTAGTGPMPVIPLFGGNVGFGYVAAAGNPLFQANSLGSPNNYSPGKYPPTSPPPPFATLAPSPNNYVVGNLGGEIVSQLSGATTGLLGVFQILETGPCPANEGLVFSFAPISSGTTNAALGTNPGPGSPWSALAGVQCNAEYPALTSGPGGLGLLSTDESGGATQYRRFTPPASFGAPVTVARGTALQPSVTQDGSGRLYATWLTNATGLRLAYSGDGGKSWFGPSTLVPDTSGSIGFDGTASATGSTGHGWLVYASHGTEYALPFVAADAYVTPRDGHLALHPKALGAHGAKITYTDTEPAKTSFKVVGLGNGHAPKTIGTFSHTDTAGPNSFHWSGRVHGHALAPGSYRLKATPSLASLKGKTISATFTIR